MISSGGFAIHQNPKPPKSNVRRDLQSRRIEYQDLQSANRIKNAHTTCRWIANPPERKNRRRVMFVGIANPDEHYDFRNGFLSNSLVGS